jgi:uncharacterized membrane protein YhaH (DUF805 family)
MADINVVPKKRSSVWMWVILAVIVALVLFMLMGAFSNEAANELSEMLNNYPGEVSAVLQNG